MSATIKDVAKRAEVSIATVSLVMSRNERISRETVLKVNRAIEDLNYHPSRSARGLVSRKTGNIGFILTEDHFLRSEPFYTRIFLGAEFEARQNEYYILLTTVASDFRKGQRLPRFVLEKNVDGIIVAGKVSDDLLQCLEKYKIPIGFVDYYPDGERFPAVLIDNLDGGMQAADHLISLGHRKIAFVGADIAHPSISDRFQGYKIAMERAGLKYGPENYVVDENYPARENGYRAAQKLFAKSKGITAVFCCNDAMAIGVLQYLKDKNIAVPGDISLIGFDDVEADQTLDPPLSTISVPKLELGVEVMRLMYDILNKKNRTSKKILVPVELIIRKSTAEKS